MVQVLHINDNNLLLQSSSRDVSRSQGYAWLKGDAVVFDFDADQVPAKHCRLAPQEINNRYWQQCEQSAISANGAGMRHSADLVWQHLSQLTQQHGLNDVALVVPSHYRESNLQLLLGIAKACGLNVVALVNKAVLAAHQQVQKAGDYLHIDVQLHQTVCSKIQCADGLVKLGDIEVLQDVGIHLMQEALLKGFQESFIKNDRFDPLHDASTEQQLFDQLPNIAKQLAEAGKASVGVQHQSRLHNTTIDSKEWQALLTPFTANLIEASADQSFVDLNAAFDTAELTALKNAGVINLGAPMEFPTNVLAASLEDGSALIYRTDLPVSAKVGGSNQTKKARVTDTPAPVKPATTGNQVGASQTGPTHLLISGKAVAIERASLGTDYGVLSLLESPQSNLSEWLTDGKVFVMNDEGRTELRVNDRLGSNLADGVITVIQVV